MHIRFVHSEQEALGIEYLSAALKQTGHSTDLILDFQSNVMPVSLTRLFQDRSRLVRKILRDKPDVLAFSIQSNNMEWACALAAQIKEHSRIPIVFGGIQVTLIPQAVIEKDAVDFAIVGEGERALLGLVEALKEGKGFAAVDNLYYKDKGQVRRNPLSGPIDPLDDLPFPDKELFKRRGIFSDRYSIITGRGCVGICTYCCMPFVRNMYQGKGEFLRRRSPENVIKELTLAKENYHIKRVFFEDDLFTYDMRWLIDFAQLYQRRIALPCVLCAHPNFLDDEVVRILKMMDCKMVEIGVQSVNEGIRTHVLKRKYSNEDLKKALLLLKKNDICSIADNIIGLPGENIEDIRKMIRFYNDIRPGKIDIFYLKYYPGLEITKKSDLDHDVVEAINKGEISSLPIVKSDQNLKNAALINRLVFVASLIYVLPRAIVNFILDKGLYNFFPRLRSCYYFNMTIFYFSLIFRPRLWGAFISVRASSIDELIIGMKQFFRKIPR